MLHCCWRHLGSEVLAPLARRLQLLPRVLRVSPERGALLARRLLPSLGPP